MKLRRPSAEEHVHTWPTYPSPVDARPHYHRSNPGDDQRYPSAPTAPWSEPLLQSLMPLPQPHYHSPCLVSGEAYQQKSLRGAARQRPALSNNNVSPVRAAGRLLAEPLPHLLLLSGLLSSASAQHQLLCLAKHNPPLLAESARCPQNADVGVDQVGVLGIVNAAGVGEDLGLEPFPHLGCRGQTHTKVGQVEK